MPTIKAIQNSKVLGEVVGANLSGIEALVTKFNVYAVSSSSFSGSGNSLTTSSSKSSPPSSSASPSSSTVDSMIATALARQGLGTPVEIQIRYGQGDVIKARFFSQDTISLLESWIQDGGLFKGSFALMTTFPKK